MSFLDRFKARSPDAVQHRVRAAGGGKIPGQIAGISALRRRPTTTHNGLHLSDDQPPKRGMWVSYQDRTAILTNIEPGDIATIMFVTSDTGENLLEQHVPCAQLRQAWFEEIPEARRPTFENAVRFGYHRRP